MPIRILIPPKNKKKTLSIYAHGKPVSRQHDNSAGTLLRLEGCGAVFLSFSRYRRAYVFCCEEHNTKNYPLPLIKPPYVLDKIQVIYKAEGRKVDLLKFMLHNMEKEYGKKIFTLPVDYWMRAASLLASYDPKTRQSAARKENIERLTQKEIKKMEASGIIWK